MRLHALYRRLLFLYPAEYRQEFGDEMAWVFERAHNELRRESAFVRAMFLAQEFQGVLAGSVRERASGVFGSQSIRSGKGGSMESKFRFPRTTLIFMLLSLLVVVLAVGKARVIVLHYGSNVGVPPEWPMALWIFGQVLLAALAFAAVFWGIFFALRRSGIQRLEELKPWLNQK